MVAYLLSELLEVGTTHRHSAARTLDSTNFTVVPSWKTSDGSTTFSLGVEAWILLQVQGLGAVDGGRYESRRLGWTLQIFHRILLYIEQPDFILYKIPCRVDAFCACARKGLANLACRPDLTCLPLVWSPQVVRAFFPPLPGNHQWGRSPTSNKIHQRWTIQGGFTTTLLAIFSADVDPVPVVGACPGPIPLWGHGAIFRCGGGRGNVQNAMWSWCKLQRVMVWCWNCSVQVWPPLLPCWFGVQAKVSQPQRARRRTQCRGGGGKKYMYVQTNGQWSMVNACTPQSEPILGTGGEKNRIMYIRFVCNLPDISAVQWWWHFASSTHGPKPLSRQKAWIWWSEVCGLLP